MKPPLTMVLVACLFLAWEIDHASAQDPIPNGDFETWLSGEPTEWATSALPFPGSITQTSDAHSGNWAVQGDVVELFPDFNAPAFVQSPAFPGFPVTQRWGSLKGFYKFTGYAFDALIIEIVMFQGGTPVGVGGFQDSSSVSSYTEFMAPITYTDGSVPDSAYIYISMYPGGGAESTHLGSAFKIDDLALSPDSGFGGECPIATAGDANGDGEVKSSDIIYLVNYVLKAGPAPLPCEAAGDANGDGEVKSSDIIYLVNYVLKAGPAPADICALIPSVWSCP